MNALLFVAALGFGSAALPSDTDAHKVTSMRGHRIALYIAAAADIITTRNAITHGAREGNPLFTPFVGETPSTLKLVAAKALSIALTEWLAKRDRRAGNYKRAKSRFELSAISWSYASGFNLRFAFR